MLPLYDLTLGGWALLLVAALFIGVAKTALPGLATIAVAMFAAVLPARESTAVMLVLLLVGDLIAIWTYRRDADWHALRKLLPIALLGLLAGVVVLGVIDDSGMKRMIGFILLTLTAVTLLLMLAARRRERAATDAGAAPAGPGAFSSSPVARWVYGGLGGFTTMVANSGGPPMTLYFLASGFDMIQFLGTQAWFFFIVNVAKLPFQGALGLHSPHSLGTDLLLVPAVLVGAALGRQLVRRINPAVFTPVIIGLTVISSAYLLV